MSTPTQPVIQGKQMEVGDALRTHVATKIEDIKNKYFNRVTEVHVTFAREGHSHQATKARISFRVGKDILVVSDATENDPYLAFDTAAEKIAKQLRRYKRRLCDHHERQEAAQIHETATLTATDYTLAQDSEAEEEEATAGDDPLIIAEITTRIDKMSVPEAVMRLELSGQPVFIFRNGKHGEANIVYRRSDGHIGWIDPAGTLSETAPARTSAENVRPARKGGAVRS